MRERVYVMPINLGIENQRKGSSDFGKKVENPLEIKCNRYATKKFNLEQTLPVKISTIAKCMITPKKSSNVKTKARKKKKRKWNFETIIFTYCQIKVMEKKNRPNGLLNTNSATKLQLKIIARKKGTA